MNPTRLPRYEMRVDCMAYCYGGTAKPERTDEEYPEFHDWDDPHEYCKAADVAKLEEQAMNPTRTYQKLKAIEDAILADTANTTAGLAQIASILEQLLAHFNPGRAAAVAAVRAHCLDKGDQNDTSAS